MQISKLPPDIAEFLKTHEIERSQRAAPYAYEYRIGDSRLLIDRFRMMEARDPQALMASEVFAWIRSLAAAEAPGLADQELSR